MANLWSLAETVNISDAFTSRLHLLCSGGNASFRKGYLIANFWSLAETVDVSDAFTSQPHSLSFRANATSKDMSEKEI